MKYFVYALVGLMLFTGTVNTLLNKYQDLTCVRNCDDPNNRHYFEQPIWQTMIMFVGEAMCLLVYYASFDKQSEPTNDERPHLTGYKQLYFVLPTLCDIIATTLMNVGLIFISASIYQMLRGAVVLFTGTFSFFFLKRIHPLYRWFGLITVFVGVSIVGLSGIVEPSGTAASPVKGSPVGIFLVVLAQGFTAAQFVIEERILTAYQIAPLKAVGLEGIIGLTVGIIFVPILHYTLGVSGPTGNMFDMFDAFRQLMIPQVFYCGIAFACSIAIFNWTGLTVTRHISATARSTIDTCRTLFIWMASLGLGWETFKYLQVPGFLLLIYGTLTFNDVIPPPPFLKPSEEEQPLLGQQEE
ncbi:hypothetical protein EDD86DRAFT_186000 [Gorgonomyces haynaldii]|nr:hypothetical protein EDD86DRAFT_186000 [Gorgonomyces haynaldii]